MHELIAFYSDMVIEIFNAKIVYAINPREYIPIHYGIKSTVFPEVYLLFSQKNFQINFNEFIEILGKTEKLYKYVNFEFCSC